MPLVRQGAHFFRGFPVRTSSRLATGALRSLGACAHTHTQALPLPCVGQRGPLFPPSRAAACWQKPEHGARVAGQGQTSGALLLLSVETSPWRGQDSKASARPHPFGKLSGCQPEHGRAPPLGQSATVWLDFESLCPET